MTNPRPWPNNAQTARDRAAEIAISGQKLIEGEMQRETDPNRKFFLLRIYVKFVNICRWLESVGAPTRPPDDHDSL